MPIYIYKCRTCGEVFEERNSIEDRQFRRCIKCDYLAEKVFGQPFNFAMALTWPEDRKEHFRRQFEDRRCERPREYG